MTRAELRTLLQQFGYDSVQSASVTAQSAALQASYLEIVSEREWSWLYSGQNIDTAASPFGTSVVTVTTPVLSVKNVTAFEKADTAIRLDPLQEIPFDEIQDMLHLDQFNGVPAYWAYHESGVVYIYPRADKQYTLTVWGPTRITAASFDADGESPVFAEQFHPLVVWGALRILAFRARDWNAYNAATVQFTQMMRQLVRAEGNSRPGRVVPWDGWKYVE